MEFLFANWLGTLKFVFQYFKNFEIFRNDLENKKLPLSQKPRQIERNREFFILTGFMHVKLQIFKPKFAVFSETVRDRVKQNKL